MTVKADVTSIVRSIEERVDALPDQVKEAQQKLAGWDKRVRRLVQERPGTVLIGAVLLGFVLARAARHA